MGAIELCTQRTQLRLEWIGKAVSLRSDHGVVLVNTEFEKKYQMFTVAEKLLEF